MKYPNFLLELPEWVHGVLQGTERVYTTAEERMQFAIALSRANVEHSGGPFGAAVFDMDTNRLIAPGVNLVVPLNCSAVHAEMVALIIAQQVLCSFDLGAENLPRCELVTSTEPCVQCFGAIVWSGIQQVVCGARAADAEAIGFDEGPKPDNWMSELEKRKIDVVRDVLRDEAREVLQYYAETGGPIYNASRRGS